MTFYQARETSKVTKLHVRRESWDPDKWFITWRGTWFCFVAGVVRPALTTDYSADDLRADDWTTVPGPLASCPVTPTEPSGGQPPLLGSGSFPDIPDGSFPSQPGGSGGGSGGGPSLPPPDEGSSVSVRFMFDNWAPAIPPGLYDRGDIGREEGWPAQSTGANAWEGKINTGERIEGGHTVATIEWSLNVTRGPLGYTITCTSEAGGFTGAPSQRRIASFNTYTLGEINGGKAYVI